MYDGLLNKTSGDSVMAIFNFPIRHSNHPTRAVLAGREIQRRCAIRREMLLAKNIGLGGSELGLGLALTQAPPALGSLATRIVT